MLRKGRWQTLQGQVSEVYSQLDAVRQGRRNQKALTRLEDRQAEIWKDIKGLEELYPELKQEPIHPVVQPPAGTILGGCTWKSSPQWWPAGNCYTIPLLFWVDQWHQTAPIWHPA